MIRPSTALAAMVRPPSREQTRLTGVILIVFLFPLLALALAPRIGIRPVDGIFLAVQYVQLVFCITAGFHRMLVHKSFRFTRPWMRRAVLIGGQLAMQGSALDWGYVHLMHHSDPDGPRDPHSPAKYGKALLQFYWSHMFWLTAKKDPAELERYGKSLLKDPDVIWAHRLFPPCLVAAYGIPLLLGGCYEIAATGNPTAFLHGALLGFVWNGIMPRFLCHHATWSINSVGHMWGARPYPVRDRSRDVVWLMVITLGEANHNKHHFFQGWCVLNRKWYLDITGHTLLWMCRKKRWVTGMVLLSKKKERLLVQQLLREAAKLAAAPA